MNSTPRARLPFVTLVLAMGVTGCGPYDGPGDAGGGDGPITTGSLYEAMVDLEALAEFPSPAFRTVQFSSYDRRSNLPEGPDWFANSDGFGGEPVPGFQAVLREPGADSIGEYLMAEVEGPGALVRLWTARIDGDVRLYLDGAEDPLFEGSADDFFRRPLESILDGLMEGEKLGEEEVSFSELRIGTVYQRDASYAPIPFSRGLRLVWIGNLAHTHFYQVEVRVYEEGTGVETFRPEDLRTYRTTIDEALAALADPDGALPSRSRQSPVPIRWTIDPGAGVDVLDLEGPGALERLELRVTAEALIPALRQTVLQVYADGYPVPQVEAPVGDFFGAAPGVNPYQSLPFTVRPDGTMISRWVMPYEKSLLVRLENRGETPVEVAGSGLPMDYRWDSQRSMHFRARWRVDHGMIPDPAAARDLPFLLARGRGVYVGTTSILLNPTPVPTPGGGWWGEGDEKVFVDGDIQPSVFGTGSEDYYNYSWSSPDIFIFPYCGQPRNDGPGNRGLVSDYRWHILDPLPFREDIRFYMEAYPHERTPGFSYARIGYHYARPGLTDDHLALTPEDLRDPRPRDVWMPAARGGARNSIMYQTESLPGGATGSAASGTLYAGGTIPVWRPEGSGGRWRITVPIREEGEYRIHFVARLDPNAPAVQVLWDGEPTSLAGGTSEIDLFRPSRTLLRDFAFPAGASTVGSHTLEFVFPGGDTRISNPEVGVDFVWVQKVG